MGMAPARRRRFRPFSLGEIGGANQLAAPSDFSNAIWTKNSANSCVYDAALAPDATLTADRISNSATVASVGVYQSIAVDVGESMSVFAKAETCSKIALVDAVSGAAYAQFDLAAGSILTSANCTASIENFGGGWYRCTAGVVAVGGGFFIVQLLDAMVAGNPWITGTNAANNSVLLWRARLWLP